ncbi:MAG: acyl-ACP--UDP-N-acetylglucosamine O-acyltransferase, partial [Candidatus Binataceae bacterium]
FCTIHRGTQSGGAVTRIGNHVLVMNYAHIAHDCQIGDHVWLANSTEVGGHTIIEEWAISGGMVGIHQFSQIGAHAFLGGGAVVTQDVPPYAMVAGDRARLVGVNEVGLQRRGFSAESIAAIKSAMRTLFYSQMLRDEAIVKVLDAYGSVPEVCRLVEFVRNSKRGVVSRERE